jgi:Flp pilus assembly protein CpaB
VDPRRPLPSRRALARRRRHRLTVALRRQPVVFWVLTLAASVSTFAVLHGALDAAAEGADAYGELVPVVVARRPLDAGDVIGPDDVEVAALPARLVPAGALDEAPIGRLVRHPILDGEAVAAARLAPDGAVGVAALLLDGERAVAIPLPTHRVPLQVGQLVDVLATVDPLAAGGTRATTSVVAEGATIIAVDEHGVTVAAPAADAVRIATALSTSVVTLAVAG